MKEKRRVLIAIILIVLVMGLVVLLRINEQKKEDGMEKIDTTPINSHVDLEMVFAEIEKIEGIGKGQTPEELEERQKESGETSFGNENNREEEREEMPEELREGEEEIIAEEEIAFGKYEGLEKKAIVKTTDDQVNEVWMIKLGNMNQQEDVCRILGNRLQKLKNAFAEDEVQMNLLKKAIIKQEDGVVIMIISPQDSEIEKTIAEAMKE